MTENNENFDDKKDAKTDTSTALFSSSSSEQQQPQMTYSREEMLALRDARLSRIRPPELSRDFDSDKGLFSPDKWVQYKWQCEGVEPRGRRRNNNNNSVPVTGSNALPLASMSVGANPKTLSSILESTIAATKNDDFLDNHHTLLSPQRRGFSSGCKAASPPKSADKSHHQQPSSSRSRWQIKNNGIDFKPAFQKNALEANSRSSRSSQNNTVSSGKEVGHSTSWNTSGHSKQGDKVVKVIYLFLLFERERTRSSNTESEQVPEWMNAGPTSVFDVIELKGFDDDEEQQEQPATEKKNVPKEEKIQIMEKDGVRFLDNHKAADLELSILREHQEKLEKEKKSSSSTTKIEDLSTTFDLFAALGIQPPQSSKEKGGKDKTTLCENKLPNSDAEFAACILGLPIDQIAKIMPNVNLLSLRAAQFVPQQPFVFNPRNSSSSPAPSFQQHQQQPSPILSQQHQNHQNQQQQRPASAEYSSRLFASSFPYPIIDQHCSPPPPPQLTQLFNSSGAATFGGGGGGGVPPFGGGGGGHHFGGGGLNPFGSGQFPGGMGGGNQYNNQQHLGGPHHLNNNFGPPIPPYVPNMPFTPPSHQQQFYPPFGIGGPSQHHPLNNNFAPQLPPFAPTMPFNAPPSHHQQQPFYPPFGVSGGGGGGLGGGPGLNNPNIPPYHPNRQQSPYHLMNFPPPLVMRQMSKMPGGGSSVNSGGDSASGGGVGVAVTVGGTSSNIFAASGGNSGGGLTSNNSSALLQKMFAEAKRNELIQSQSSSGRAILVSLKKHKKEFFLMREANDFRPIKG
uniref:Uncharacterized protein n=1 Tax=Meloidogyne javanica TaxID=6303 RepID=A0A915MIN5_MELJA